MGQYLYTPAGGDDRCGSGMKGRTPHIEHQANHFSDVRNEMIAIRGDMHGMERRLADKMDENQKWIIVLLILSILIPLLIALVTK